MTVVDEAVSRCAALPQAATVDVTSRGDRPVTRGIEMDPYTEYMGTVLARSEPSYYVRQPRAARRSRGPRANRWRPRLAAR